MTGQIPPVFIEELLARTDIVELLRERIQLRRAGANYLGRCPFHNEKTPSFSVNPVKQFYHCFGCGAGGDAIRFITEYDGLQFVEAVEWLANRAGLSIPTEKQKKDNHIAERAAPIYGILLEASICYQTQLRHHALAASVHDYLKKRGLTGNIAKQFSLGFAPPAWDTLRSQLGTTPERLAALLAAGLIVQKKDSDHFYDRFRDRVMFPIRDRRGRVVGFGGRVMTQEGEPKYLNSPETFVFSKGQELYGLYEARLNNRALSNLVVVEGYLDVLSLVQAGITNVVAALGTALTERHVDLLFRQVSELIFCFDGDKAGLGAAKRALPFILPHMKEGRRVRFMILPAGEDPDSCVRKEGRASFLERMHHAVALTDFLFETLTENLDLNHLENRAQLITLAKPLLKLLPTGVLKEMLYDRLAQLARVDRGIMQEKSGDLKRVSGGSRVGNKPIPLPANPAQRAIAMLLKHRGLLAKVGNLEELCHSDVPDVNLLCRIIGILKKQPALSIEAIMADLPSDYVSQFPYSELTTLVDSLPENGIEQEFLGSLKRLRDRAYEEATAVLLLKAKSNALSFEEKERLKRLLEWKIKKDDWT